MEKLLLGAWGVAVGLGFSILMAITNSEQLGAAASIYIATVVFTAIAWGL